MTQVAGTPTRADALAAEQDFSTAAGTSMDWAGVVAQANALCTGDAHRAAARLSIACRRRAVAEDEPLADGELRAGIRRYRYDRGLLAAEDFTAWVTARGLD